MQPHSLVTIVTIAALLTYMWMGMRVSRARRVANMPSPQMHGDPVVERHIRVHANTLEWLPLFLAPLWLFAIYGNDLVAAALGLVWIVGRIIYAFGYVADPKKRLAGFLIQLVACVILMVGVAWRAIHMLVAFGA